VQDGFSEEVPGQLCSQEWEGADHAINDQGERAFLSQEPAIQRLHCGKECGVSGRLSDGS
jgi:hypothetical protein